jgi:hypothetical protein
MPSNDRKGKWLPFDALEGYKDSLKKIEYEKDKILKPIIYPDQLEEMNEALCEAVENQKEICISYYRNGYIYEKIGIVSKIDPINRELIINNSKIKLNMIVKLGEKDCE